MGKDGQRALRYVTTSRSSYLCSVNGEAGVCVKLAGGGMDWGVAESKAGTVHRAPCASLLQKWYSIGGGILAIAVAVCFTLIVVV